MSRPIAYNTSFPLSGSITNQQGGGIISYTIDGAGRDYTTFAGKKWVPSADGAAPIIFVTDSFTQGYHTAANSVPLFYTCAGTSSAAIIYTANKLPGSPGNYTTVDDAITDLLSNDWFILQGEEPFKGANADQMVMCLDVPNYISYPRTGTVWYDISGYNKPATLVNGPSFNSSGWFNLDGTNDYINNDNVATNLNGNWTIEMDLFPTVDGYNGGAGGRVIWSTHTNYENRWIFIIMPNTGQIGYVSQGGFSNGVIGDRWKKLHFTRVNGDIRLYINGVFDSVKSVPDYTGNNQFNIGQEWDGTNPSDFYLGDVGNVKVYGRELTDAQIQQNYFGSPIVTDGLVFAVDANNIVSYPKSGTTWYNLTGSVVSGALTNGPTFDPTNGGAIKFDGVDDYVNFGSAGLDFGTGNFNVSCWVKTSTTTADYTGIVSKYNSGNGLWILLSPTSKYVVFGWNGSIFLTSTTTPINNGVWRHISCQRTGATTAEIYVDGVLITSGIGSNTSSNSSAQLDIGRMNVPGRYLNGDVANTKIYNKALTAAEIQQNYQAEQYRFDQNLGIVTGDLSLYLDASDSNSYPGSGTTWYDISGNSNNVSLVNGPSLNTVNGFSYFNFDGSNDYGTTGNVLINSAQYAIFLVFRPLNVSTVRGGFAGQNDFIEYGIYNTSGYGHKYFTNAPGVLDGNVEMYTNNTWYIACLTNTPLYDGTPDRQVYFLNGGEVVNKPYVATVGSQTYNFNIAGNGIWGVSGDFMPIDIASLLVYERGLDKNEVLQNYNYLKSLYGLNV